MQRYSFIHFCQCWLFVCLLLAPLSALAQHRFSHGTIDKIELPLSQASMLHMMQDQSGYLWIGTQRGLDRYDGFSIRPLQELLAAGCKAPATLVHTVLEDANGNLMLGTDQGVYQYDKQQRCVSALLTSGNDATPLKIFGLFKDSQGRVWASGDELYVKADATADFVLLAKTTGVYGAHISQVYDGPQSDFNGVVEYQQDIWVYGLHGLQKIDRESLQLKQVFAPVIHQATQGPNPIHHVIVQDDVMWLGTADGVYQYFADTGRFLHFRFNPNTNADSLDDNFVSSLYLDKQQQLWVGTFNGIHRYDAKNVNFVSYLVEKTAEPGRTSNRTGTILQDSHQQLWASVSSGIVRYEPSHDQFVPLAPAELAKLGNTNGGNVFRLFNDESGAIFISADLNGLYRLTPKPAFFKLLRHQDRQSNVFDNNIVRAVFQEQGEHSDTLWLGLDGAGVKRFELDKYGAILDVQRYRHQHAEPGSGLVGEFIHAIDKDPAGKLWLATNFGLRYWDSQKADFVPYSMVIPSNGSSLSPQILTFTSHQGQWWLAGDGILGCVDQHGAVRWWTARSVPLLKDNRIHNLHFDQSGALWLATLRGPILFNEATSQFTAFDLAALGIEPEHQWVHGIYQDPQRNLWFATRGGGLLQLAINDNQQQWRRFTTEQGLADNVIYGLLADQQNGLWLSSNRGIMRFDLLSHAVQNFNVNDGLQADEFNHGVAFQDSQGQLYFGGINGLNYFSPAQLAISSNNVKLQLQSLSVHGQQQVADNHHFQLQHQQNYLHIRYVGLHLLEPDALRYQYRLVGLDEHWIDAGSQRQAFYNALPAGSYQFELKVANSDGVWGQAQRLFTVTIQPPWWHTPQAYAAYVIAVLLLFGWYHQRRNISEAKLKRAVDKATCDLAIANEQIRLQFQSFAHEVKTPLMSVNNHCELVNRKLVLASQKHSCLEINQSLEYLQHAIKALDDIRTGVRQELNLAELRIQNNYQPLHLKVEPIITACAASRRNRLLEKHLTLTIQLAPDLAIWAQCGVLELALDNLIDNAIVYTPVGGTIAVSATSNGKEVVIAVNDSGPGIADKEKSRVFMHAYRGNHNLNNEGRGMGLYLAKNIIKSSGGTIYLSDSTLGGACFTFVLPSGDHAQAACYLQQKSAIGNLSLLPTSATAATDEMSAIAAQEQLSESAQPSVGALPNELPAERILLVEDNAALRQSMALLLGERYQVDTAESGEQGLQKAQQLKPDVIITDISMEQRDAGIRLIHALKQDEDLSYIPIIACSAFGDSQTKLAAIEAMADVWLDKDASFSLLEAHLHALLSRYRTVRQKVSVAIAQDLQLSQPDAQATGVEATPAKVQASEEKYFVETVKALIAEHYLDEELTIDVICSRYFKYSQRNMQYKAKKYLPADTSLKALLDGYRGLKAMELMAANKHLRLIEALSGFRTESQLNRWFKLNLGVTPGAYRQHPTAIELSAQLQLIIEFFALPLPAGVCLDSSVSECSAAV